jgi:DNA-binding transcriptional LysR family regulator
MRGGPCSSAHGTWSGQSRWPWIRRDAAENKSGQLRITLPYRAWQLIIAPKLAAFETAYPDVELEFAINEALVDIVSEGFHAGIRLGDHLSS